MQSEGTAGEYSSTDRLSRDHSFIHLVVQVSSGLLLLDGP
jgi:hypothetical protein